MGHFICVSGNIGSGKTTVSQLIAQELGFAKHDEPTSDNPFLARFYENKEQWAYKSQQYFLLTRFIALEKISQQNTGCVQDRSIYEDMEIFAGMHMRAGFFTNEQAARYRALCAIVYEELKPPDLLVFLRASLPSLRSRIARRGRPYEQELVREDNPYLAELNDVYEQWISSYSLGPVIVLDTDQFNFAADSAHRARLLEQVRAALGAVCC